MTQVTRLLGVSSFHDRGRAEKKVVFAPRGAEAAPETTWVP
jgi:hypothetical protein